MILALAGCFEGSETATTNSSVTPSAPTSLNATAGATQIDLTWTAPTTGSGTITYNILRGTSSGTETALANGVSSTVYTDSSASFGTTYYYYVVATNSVTTSVPSNEVSASPTGVTPSAPLAVIATAGAAQIDLAWSVPSIGSGTITYNILRGTSPGSETSLATGVSGLVYTDSSASYGTTYYYVITATGNGGTSPTSSEVSATPTGTTAYYAFGSKQLNVVTGVTATASTASNCLTSPSTTAGIVAGQWVSSGNWSLAANTKVVAVPGTCAAGQIQLSINPTASQSDTFSFYTAQITGYSLNNTTHVMTALSSSPFAATKPLHGLQTSTNGKFLYGIASLGSGSSIEVYGVTPSTGALTALTAKNVNMPTFDGLSSSKLVRINGSDYLYFANYGTSEVSGYSINSTDGTLTIVPGSPFFIDGILSASYPAPAFGSTVGDGSRYACGPSEINSATGHFLYVACGNWGNVGGEALAGFSINQSTGALTKLTGSPWASSFGGGANGVAATPDGNYVHLFNGGNGGWGPSGIDSYHLDSSGIPTIVNTLGTPTTFTGSDPASFFGVIDPSGLFAYIFAVQSSLITILPLTSGLPAAAATSVSANNWGIVKMDVDALFFGENGPDLYIFSRNSSTGALTAFTGSPVTAAATWDFAFSTVIY